MALAGSSGGSSRAWPSTALSALLLSRCDQLGSTRCIGVVGPQAATTSCGSPQVCSCAWHGSQQTTAQCSFFVESLRRKHVAVHVQMFSGMSARQRLVCSAACPLVSVLPHLARCDTQRCDRYSAAARPLDMPSFFVESLHRKHVAVHVQMFSGISAHQLLFCSAACPLVSFLSHLARCDTQRCDRYSAAARPLDIPLRCDTQRHDRYSAAVRLLSIFVAGAEFVLTALGVVRFLAASCTRNSRSRACRVAALAI